MASGGSASGDCIGIARLMYVDSPSSDERPQRAINWPRKEGISGVPLSSRRRRRARQDKCRHRAGKRQGGARRQHPGGGDTMLQRQAHQQR